MGLPVSFISTDDQPSPDFNPLYHNRVREVRERRDSALSAACLCVTACHTHTNSSHYAGETLHTLTTHGGQPLSCNSRAALRLRRCSPSRPMPKYALSWIYVLLSAAVSRVELSPSPLGLALALTLARSRPVARSPSPSPQGAAPLSIQCIMLSAEMPLPGPPPPPRCLPNHPGVRAQDIVRTSSDGRDRETGAIGTGSSREPVAPRGAAWPHLQMSNGRMLPSGPPCAPAQPPRSRPEHMGPAGGLCCGLAVDASGSRRVCAAAEVGIGPRQLVVGQRGYRPTHPRQPPGLQPRLELARRQSPVHEVAAKLPILRGRVGAPSRVSSVFCGLWSHPSAQCGGC